MGSKFNDWVSEMQLCTPFTNILRAILIKTNTIKKAVRSTVVKLNDEQSVPVLNINLT